MRQFFWLFGVRARPKITATLIEGKIHSSLDDFPLQVYEAIPAAKKSSRSERFFSSISVAFISGLALSLLVATTLFGGNFKIPSKKKAEVNTKPSLAICNIEGVPSGKRPTFFEEGSQGFYCAADFLYMQATVDGFAYAWSFPESLPPTGGDLVRSTPIPGGVFHDIDFAWAPAVRLAAGWHFSFDNWDALLTWTRFESSSTSNASVPNLTNNSLFALWMPFGYIAGSYDAQHASAQWKLHFNTIDLDLGRAAFAIQSMVINPYLGMRGAFIHQHFRAKYQNGNFLAAEAPAGDVQFVGRNMFNGWGIRPGVNTSWYFLRDWSLFANGAMSFLYGKFQFLENARSVTVSPEVFVDEHDHYYHNAFAFDLSVGLKWEMFFSSCGRHLQLSAGYEMMHWFDQNKLVNLTYIDNAPGLGPYVNGDLGIHGVVVSGGFDY